MTGWILRPGRDGDADGIIALIGTCWGEYPGCILDVDRELPELRALATYYAEHRGALWVAEAGGAIVGMIATQPLDGGTWELCKVYALPAWHGTGLGHALLDAAEAHAISAGATRLALWTDTRFDRAHRFYEKRSYVRNGPIRALNDISRSLEYAYAKPVDGIEALDAAGAASAEPRLSALLTACVAEGAGVSFLPPLRRETARAFWAATSEKVSAGSHVLLAAWRDGVLVGTVTLAMAMPENQPHRAEVAKLLVDPAFRRGGVARALMSRLEHEAARAGRPLLILDTRAGDRAERLYRSMGWTELGTMPGHALSKDGSFDDTVFFWKRLAG
jgi:GNAT superfamily N-acetyltransferase